jgi:hypothetical protein
MLTTMLRPLSTRLPGIVERMLPFSAVATRPIQQHPLQRLAATCAASSLPSAGATPLSMAPSSSALGIGISAAMIMRPLLAGLIPSLLLTGKRKTSGKSKRFPKPANHGARPCNHVGRRQRAAAIGNVRYQPKR